MNKYNDKILMDELPGLHKIIKLLPKNIEYDYNPYTCAYNSIKITAQAGFRVKVEQLKEVCISPGIKVLKLIEITEEQAIEYLMYLMIKKHKEDIESHLNKLKEAKNILSETSKIK